MLFGTNIGISCTISLFSNQSLFREDFTKQQQGILKSYTEVRFWQQAQTILETPFEFSLQIWETIKSFSEVFSHNRDVATKILKQSQLASNNLLSCKNTLKAHASAPDTYAPYLCKKRHFFRWQQSSLAVTAKMWKLGPLFTSIVSLSQSGIQSESRLQTHNNDK